jgi:hypothetical protein
MQRNWAAPPENGINSIHTRPSVFSSPIGEIFNVNFPVALCLISYYMHSPLRPLQFVNVCVCGVFFFFGGVVSHPKHKENPTLLTCKRTEDTKHVQGRSGSKLYQKQNRLQSSYFQSDKNFCSRQIYSSKI